MTDKQIIIDGIKTSKEDFIDNFAIELTNRNIFEREQIGDKYFEIILAKEQENEELKKDLDFQKNMYECARADEEDKFEEILELKQTLAEIKEIAEKEVNNRMLFADKESFCDFNKILKKINEVEDDKSNN